MKNWITIMHRTLIVLAVVSIVIAGQEAVGEGEKKFSNCMQPKGMDSLALFLMGMTPECDEKGHLLPKQCFEYSKHCVCVRKDGTVINKPSKMLKDCKCIREKDKQENSRMLGCYIPQCEEDGSFSKLQCHYSTGYCFCADPTTGKNTTEHTKDDITCD